MADNLRERETPQSRVLVYIKDPLYCKDQKRKLVELLGFKSITTNISMTGQGTASVFFPNYKSSLIKFISIDSVQGTETKENGRETFNPNAYSFMQRLSKEDKSNFFKNLWNDMSFSRGDRKYNEKGDDDFMYYSRSRGDIATGKDRNIMKKIKDEEIIHALPFLDLFDPVFIDFKGQDGFWYAGFTGIIGSISDSYTKTGDQSITIGCKDLSSLLDNVSLVSGWNRMSFAESKSNLKNFVYSTEANVDSASKGAYANIFSKYNKVSDIITAVIERAQPLWRLDDFGISVGVSGFKFDNSYWKYQGISGRRGSIQQVANIENMDPREFTEEYNLTKRHYLYDENSTFNDKGEKRILIDPLISDFDNLFIHKLLNNSLSLYKDSLKSANEILNDLCAKMFAYKYFDANGNLIIELPKLNAFPNLEDYGGRSEAVAIRHHRPKRQKEEWYLREKKSGVKKGDKISEFAKRNNISVNKLKELNGGITNTKIFGSVVKKGRTVYFLKEGTSPIISKEWEITTTDTLSDIKNIVVSPKNTELLTPVNIDYKWSTLNFHGKNYVLTDDDFISFTTSIDEAPLVTVTATDSSFPYLDKFNENILFSKSGMHGVSVADYDKLAKLGVRRYQTQSIYNVSWPSQLVGARVLSYQSAAIMERVNAQAHSGTIQLNHRPDIQLGRIYINPLRMEAYLITSISNSWSPGGSHVTTLSVTYGHPIHKALEVPWSAIFAEPQSFGFESTAEFNNLSAVDSNGKSIISQPDKDGEVKNTEVEELEKS